MPELQLGACPSDWAIGFWYQGDDETARNDGHTGHGQHAIQSSPRALGEASGSAAKERWYIDTRAKEPEVRVRARARVRVRGHGWG